MKNLILTATVAASTILGAHSVAAEGHITKQLVVSKGICPGLIDTMLGWARGHGEYTAYAVPTVTGTCGQANGGRQVTAGIATSANKYDARRSALRLCNENRGDLGRCVVAGMVRNKP